MGNAALPAGSSRKRAARVKTDSRLRAIFAAAVSMLVMGAARGALASNEDVILLPTALASRRTPDEPILLHAPGPEDGRALLLWARQVDVTLSEAAQDLGLTLEVSGRLTGSLADLADDALVTRATQSWVVSPRLEVLAGRVRLRIVAVAPRSKVLLVRSQELEARDAEVRAMVMMRDLIQTGRGSPECSEERPAPERDQGAIVHSARSEGRAVLALNAAALGGYVGYTIQRAGGSNDARLTYPLIALGTGIGLGGSMIVADEWDVGLGDAWYLSAGAFWPGIAGFLLADGYQKHPDDDRFVFSVLGAASGIGLATTALTFKGMGEGGALLTHSGGAFGLLLGGLTQLAYEGRTDTTPTRGMGYGTGLGVLVAGTLATGIQIRPSRVLLIDLGASLGALTGAAAASPLLISNQRDSKLRNRAWLGTVAFGTVAGGALGWFLTRTQSSKPSAPPRTAPVVGIMGESITNGGRSVPVYGAGVQGTW